jgi:hypothetical protein
MAGCLSGQKREFATLIEDEVGAVERAYALTFSG